MRTDPKYRKLLVHLASARSAIDSAVIALEELLEPEQCDHPEELRTDTSTMGWRNWTCDPRNGGCGYEHKEKIRKDQAEEETGG